MVHALAIAAAATAGVSVAIAFELAVFKPWRDENWPDGVAEGVRSELQKLRDDFGLAVSEIREDVRSLRDQRRARQRRAERLRDDELDDFRQGVGEEHSAETGLHGFEMHEREAEAYRERLRASFAATHAQQYGPNAGLRRRRSRVGEPSAPHHRIGDLDEPEDTTQTQRDTEVSEDLAGLTFASSSANSPDTTTTANSFPGLEGTTSSWAAAFDRRPQSMNDSELRSSDTPGSAVVVTAPSHPQDLMALDTNGLSQTLSDQHSFHRVHDEHELPSVSSRTSDIDYDAEHEDSDELAFEMLSVSDTSDGQSDHWSQIHSPTSSERPTTDTHRNQSVLEHVSSEGESWAEISSPEA